MSLEKMMVFTGNANRALALEIANRLGVRLGRAKVEQFSDGEVTVEILEHVRGRDCFIIQPTSAPSSENLMELACISDALKRSSAGRITAVLPYFGYARQDRRTRSARVPITAKVVARFIESVGIDRLTTVDLHADQIQGFFDIPVDNAYAAPILLSDIWRSSHKNLLVVSPDVGGVLRARAFAKRLDTDLAIIDKRRPADNVAEVMNIIGKVKEKTCILIDDIVDTAGTLCKASSALKEKGAIKVIAYCTHAVLSGRAIETIEDSVLDELVVTDTISTREKIQSCSKIRIVTIAGLLAETILRISNDESVSSIFME